MPSHGTLETPVGTLGVVSDGAAIVRIGWRAADAARWPSTTDPDDETDPILGEAIAQLAAYFTGDRRVFDVPISLGSPSPTTAAVLSTLYEQVGYGKTITYGELAALSGTAVPARGIGAIMGANPLPIIVPCHRVLASDGLGGYSGGAPGEGLATKRWLLGHEGSHPAALF